jgi:hypothetical protein
MNRLHTAIQILTCAATLWTMSWSNVCDYFPSHAAFHECAAACSKHGDTIHFLHSLNWLTSVKVGDVSNKCT